MRQLVTLGVGKRLTHEEIVPPSVVVELGSGEGVGDGDLYSICIEFLGEIDRALNGIFRLTRQANNEVTVNEDTQLPAFLGERTSHFQRRTLLDVFQNGRIAGLEPNDE